MLALLLALLACPVTVPGDTATAPPAAPVTDTGTTTPG